MRKGASKTVFTDTYFKLTSTVSYEILSIDNVWHPKVHEEIKSFIEDLLTDYRNKSIKACGRKDQLCSSDAKENMEKVTGVGASCSCLPGCFGLQFTESISVGKLSRVINTTAFGEDWKVNVTHFEKNMAVIHFYFASSYFPIIEKTELYGFTEILSNVGGLLGLCMGFSFLSVVEILYFITLRWFLKWMKDRRKKERKNNHRHVFIRNQYSNYPFLK